MAILGIVFTGSLSAFLFNQWYAGVQGRYLYPSLVGLAVLSAWGWCRLTGRGARLLPPLVVLAGLATQAGAWALITIAWWAPRTDVHGVTRLRRALDGVLRWSPWPTAATLVPFALVVLMSLVVLGLAAWGAVKPTARTGAPMSGEMGRPALPGGAADSS
ncbi:MAG TPA: hypothetical protein VFX70_03185 [Mycobacteriales bacterium]|nr:hypothetical protein [Mycobacteriales bacterium]